MPHPKYDIKTLDTDVCGIVSIYESSKQSCYSIGVMRLDKYGMRVLGEEKVVFDPVHLRIRLGCVDDRTAHKVTPIKSGGLFSFKTELLGEIVGDYEMVEDETGFQLYKMEKK